MGHNASHSIKKVVNKGPIEAKMSLLSDLANNTVVHLVQRDSCTESEFRTWKFDRLLDYSHYRALMLQAFLGG